MVASWNMLVALVTAQLEVHANFPSWFHKFIGIRGVFVYTFHSQSFMFPSTCLLICLLVNIVIALGKKNIPRLKARDCFGRAIRYLFQPLMKYWSIWNLFCLIVTRGSLDNLVWLRFLSTLGLVEHVTSHMITIYILTLTLEILSHVCHELRSSWSPH